MKVTISNNPFIKVCITKIRDKNTDSFNFSNNIKKITVALALEAIKDISIKEVEIESPIEKCKGFEFSNEISVVSILRAGLCMSEALKDMFVNSSVGHIGLCRNEETLKCSQYYENMPENIKNNFVFLCDPLIATGGSLLAALEILKKYNCKNICVLGIICSKQAIDAITSKYPDIPIYVAQLDEKLNKHGYVIPGAGDAGDRIFKTK